jgi:tungstate transport system permease protein
LSVIGDGIIQAGRLLISGDPEVLRITWRTLQITGTATLISMVIGVPVGVALALRKFFGRWLMVSAVNFGMGLPPVVVGLVVWLLLFRYGPLGWLDLLYTPGAMIIAEVIIAFPVVAGFTLAAIQAINPKMRFQILALGANSWQLLWLLLREARLGILAAVIAGFGAVISEVGAAMMVGGNIEGLTRVLTTTIDQEVSMGDFVLAMALSVILLLLTFIVTAILTWYQQHRRQPQ